jgi:hypothetical protein
VFKTDVNGNPTTEEDKEKMYEFYFQSVDLREKNIPLALADQSTKHDYTEVTMDDPYWWEDDDLKNALYQQEFNFVETKFLNMNIMYRLTEMLFEVIYVFRMLLDKKDQLVYTEINLPKIFNEDKKVKLFNAVMLLCALLCKKNKMAGNVLHTPTKILSILGFNFQADFATIRQYIQSNSKLIDQKILTYIQKMDISKPEDINNLFVNIRDLNDFLVDHISKSENLKEYRAYKNLFNALMITQETEILFKKSDGTIATTFLDYLNDADIEAYDFVNNCEEGRISEYIDHILYKLNELVTSLKYLYILNDSNNVLLNAVITLIRFFKSYTTDLASFNILYLMDSRYYNKIKLINDINYINKVSQTGDTFKFSYNEISTLQTNVKIKEKILMNDGVKLIWEE